MGKRSNVKRLSSMSNSTSNAIDVKARRRIEELYELTDEIINAYNEINEKYVHQIYRKFKQLQEVNKKLQEKLNHHHCTGCKCDIQTNGNDKHDEEESNNSQEDENNDSDDDYENDNATNKNSALPSSTISSIKTRSKDKNPFIISDIDDTQNFDDNASNNEDKTSMDIDQNTNKTNNKNNDDNQSEEDDDDDVDEDDGMTRLPLALQNIIRRKAKRNRNEKAYLLHIPRYPALCEFVRDQSPKSFDSRPSHDQVRPLISNHLSKYLAKEPKIRIRLRDELREIHRSYMRTFMTDPHSASFKSSNQKTKELPVKKSPM